MAFNKSVWKDINATQGPFGVPETMYQGFFHSTGNTATVHPLEKGELDFHDQMDKMNMSMLRKTQGLHAPLRLMMERNAANKVQRLPCLHSSRLQYETLTGRTDTLDMKDVLNQPSDAEFVGAPHITMEKRLGLL